MKYKISQIFWPSPLNRQRGLWYKACPGAQRRQSDSLCERNVVIIFANLCKNTKMKCVIILGILAFVAFSSAQLQGTEGGDNLGTTAQLGSLLAGTSMSSGGQMSNLLGGDQGIMSLANMLSRAGGRMGGGMFRGMTGNSGQWGNMGNLLRMMAGRGRWGMNNMGQRWGMNDMMQGRDMDNMGQRWGMGQGSGLGNHLTYSMLRRGKYFCFFLARFRFIYLSFFLFLSIFIYLF